MKKLIEQMQNLYPKHFIWITSEIYVTSFGNKYVTYRVRVSADSAKLIINQSFSSFTALQSFINSLETHSDSVEQASEVLDEICNG